MSASKPAGQRQHRAAVLRVVGRPDLDEQAGWVSRAWCRVVDADALFVTGAAQRKAAALCRRCRVMQECAAEALDNRVEHGVRGGMTERQRRALLQQHPEVVSWSDFLRIRRNRSAG